MRVPNNDSMGADAYHDSIYEAEGEQSSIKRSQDPLNLLPEDVFNKSISKGSALEPSEMRQSAEDLVDPEALASQQTMKAQMEAAVKSNPTHDTRQSQMENTKTNQTMTATVAHQIERDGREIQTGLEDTQQTAAITIMN